MPELSIFRPTRPRSLKADGEDGEPEGDCVWSCGLECEKLSEEAMVMMSGCGGGRGVCRMLRGGDAGDAGETEDIGVGCKSSSEVGGDAPEEECLWEPFPCPRASRSIRSWSSSSSSSSIPLSSLSPSPSHSL